VIHNAGIARNRTFDGMDDEHWFPVIETHLLGGFSLARAVWPTMAGAGYGRFVITLSATGMWGRAEGANYGAAKAGLTHRYYSAIRGRYAETFVAVNDGWVAPAGEPPTAEELAAHLDIVEDRSAYSVPHSLDEVAIASRRIVPEAGTEVMPHVV
jgi:NAD(P)-dependent dehydrogenase (short-subunit alcohol dehydrogenase family)